MKRISFIFLLLFIGCDKDKITGVSNEYTPNSDYLIDLRWDDNATRSITQVDIKWDEWIENDSTNFLSYYVKDVTTENDKLLEDFTNSSDTTYAIDFATGTFLKVCVLANYINEELSETYMSSDTMQFFTNPLAPVSNITIDTEPLQHNISWSPSTDENSSGLLVYRSYIQEGEAIPNLLINPSSGLPEQEEWQWDIVFEGTNIETNFIDTIDIFSDYKYFYAIKVQIEGAESIENYRYSMIKPAVSEMINPINEHAFNLDASNNFEDVIILNWNVYTADDFYSYEIWRTDIETTSHQNIQNIGQKLVEVTNKNLDYFEDRFSIGSGKKWYYFIKVYNNYGQEINSEIIEGDTRL